MLQVSEVHTCTCTDLIEEDVSIMFVTDSVGQHEIEVEKNKPILPESTTGQPLSFLSYLVIVIIAEFLR